MFNWVQTQTCIYIFQALNCGDASYVYHIWACIIHTQAMLHILKHCPHLYIRIRKKLRNNYFFCELIMHKWLVDSWLTIKAISRVVAILCCITEPALSFNKQNVELTALDCEHPKNIVQSPISTLHDRSHNRLSDKSQLMHCCNMTACE